MEGVLLLYQCKRWMIKLTVVIIEEYQCYQIHTKLYPISFSQSSPYIDEIIGVHQCGFRLTDQLLIRFFLAFVRYWRKSASTMRQYISYSKPSKKAHDTVRSEV
jgi:hypothetical protein